MKRHNLNTLVVLLLTALSASIATAEPVWLTSYQEALNQAKSANKLVLINFTGSDWCGWCIKLRKEVFVTADFEAYANANFVLLEADFPRGKKLSSEQTRANQNLARQFRVEGYPTIVVTDSDGRKVGQSGYVPGGPKAFATSLQNVKGVKTVAWPDAPPAVAEVPAPVAPPVVAPRGPQIPLVQPAPARYESLSLRGISGPTNRRLALINNQTFAPGEKARTKLGDKIVDVVCLEIRENSVLVTVENRTEPVELTLGVK